MTGPAAGRALVVGASSAIGRAVAVRLARDGFHLHLWGRDRPRLEETARACAATSVGRSGDDASPVPVPVVETLDVTSGDELHHAVADLATGDPLRVAVWAAGAFDWADAHEADPGAWRRVLDVGLVAAAEWTALLAPTLVAHAPSALVYVGSTAAHRTFPHNAAYVAAKHGLAALAGATWLDLRAHRVGVCLVSPGPVAAGPTLDSPMAAHPELLLDPVDVGDAVGYVAGLAIGGRGCPTVLRIEPYLDT